MIQKPSHILVPLDGSRLAEAALPAAFGLAERLGVPVLLLHVVERKPPTQVHGEPHLGTAGEAEEYLEAVAERGREAGVEVEVHTHSDTVVSDVSGAIAEHAKEFDAELIVLCAHGRGGVRDLLVGSIAQQTLRRGTASVLLIRPGPDGSAPPFDCRVIAVALDPRRHGDVALRGATRLAKVYGSRLHLVSVVPTPSALPPSRRAAGTLLPRATHALLEMESRDLQETLEERAERLDAAGLPSTVEVRRGNPVAEIAASLREHPADLLVVATHGRAGIGGWMAGSFAQRIALQAEVPILLIRVPENAELE
ncbi:MAG TPA: universal stress protein [Longimicrobiaceae bacterium]|nr:universal stress protein [Longimicrobiaceae bacterium]